MPEGVALEMLEKVVDLAEQIKRRINMTQLGQLYEKEMHLFNETITI